jgi:TetR/AcrR family transcriptional regulator, tetracycline repressor protein
MARQRAAGGGAATSPAVAASELQSRRARLTRPRVVATALAIVDRDGLEGLTMRALGHELGVDPMAAYHWFPNKPAILQGVGEAILAEVALPDQRPGLTWAEVARSMGREYRAALLRHPNALPVASTQPVMTPRGFELIERAAAALVAGGLRPGAALEAINTVAAYVIGSAVTEAGVTPGTEPVEHEAIMASYASIDADRFPTMVAAMAEASELLGDDHAQFDTAIDAIIRGLEASFRERGLLA